MWTGWWSWILFGDRGLPIGQLALVSLPVVISAVAVFPLPHRSQVIVRGTSAVVLIAWAILLFAWMFFVSAALMAVGAGMSNPPQDRDVAAQPARDDAAGS